MERQTLRYEPTLEQRWKEGSLWKSWLKDYPKLFGGINGDLAPYVEAQHRRGYFFPECLAATYYHQKGLNVLIETYMPHGGMTPSQDKMGVVESLVGADNFHALQRMANPQGTAFPGLLVWHDPADYFFVEVKKGNDRLSNEQRTMFEEIQRLLGCRIEILSLIPFTPLTLQGGFQQPKRKSKK